MLKRVSIIMIGLGLTSFLFGGGTGGCGGGSSAGGGGGATTTGSTAASKGAVTGVTGGIGAALDAAIGGAGGAALTLKSHEGVDDDIDCVEASDGSIDCGDEDASDETGSLDCGFEEPGTAEDCGTGFHYAINSDFTMTFTNFSAGDECGQEVVLNGTVTGHIEGSLDECTGTQSVTGNFQTSDMTATLEDGTTHNVTFDLTYSADGETESISGEICVDGECSTVDSFDDLESEECEEEEDEHCVEECVADCSADGAAFEETSGDGVSCEEDCQAFCADDHGSCEVTCSMDANDDGVADDPDHFACQQFADENPDDEFETDNVECHEGCCELIDGGGDGDDCSGGVTDKTEALTLLAELDTSPQEDNSEAVHHLQEACSVSSTDVHGFLAALLCGLGIVPEPLASDADIEEAVDNYDLIDTSALESSCSSLGSL